MATLNPYESPQLDPLIDTGLRAEPPADHEKFGVVPLFLYLFGIAIVAGVSSCRGANWWSLSSATLGTWRATVIAGVGVATLLLAAYRWWAGSRSFPKHFGHWFLLCDGLGWIADQPLEFLYYENFVPSLDDPTDWELNRNPSDWILVLRTFFHLTTCASFGFSIWKCKLDESWRRYAYSRLVYAAWCVLQGLFFASGSLLIQTLLVAAIVTAQIACFTIALAGDFRRPKSRDYLHWLGIAIEFYMYAMQNVLYVWTLTQILLAMRNGN